MNRKSIRHGNSPNKIMKKILAATLVAVTSSLTSTSMGALFVSAADLTSATPNSSYSGVVGVRFGVEATNIPPGQTVRVSELGFFAGKSGQFVGAGIVDFSHTVTLSGSRDYFTRDGDYSSLTVGEVVVPQGNLVDADGWSWVTLASPVDLVGGAYYTLVASMQVGQATDPYFDPYSGPGASASIIAPNSIFYNGAGDSYMIGRYGLGAGQEAFDASGYLGPNMKFAVVPEVSTAMSLVGFAGLGLLRRRR